MIVIVKIMIYSNGKSVLVDKVIPDEYTPQLIMLCFSNGHFCLSVEYKNCSHSALSIVFCNVQ